MAGMSIRTSFQECPLEYVCYRLSLFIWPASVPCSNLDCSLMAMQAEEDALLRRCWLGMVRRELPATYRTLVHRWRLASQNAARLSHLAAREAKGGGLQRKGGQLSRKEAGRETTLRVKRLVKDMMSYWRRSVRDVEDMRKQVHMGPGVSFWEGCPCVRREYVVSCLLYSSFFQFVSKT